MRKLAIRLFGTLMRRDASARYREMIRGRRKFLLNRDPHSTHIRLLGEHGFEFVRDATIEDSGGIGLADLAPQFAGMSDQDLHISGAFILARKRPPGP